MPKKKDYFINIDPRILELLGPSLYTNIYYVLAELIANAYDANAKNVYIVEKSDRIIVEDDGAGMSHKEGDIDKYLNVAAETRTTKDDEYVKGSKKQRKKMGRKGVGKLAALSVSQDVYIQTKKNGEKSGFILSRRVGKENRLRAINEEEIFFEKIGTKKNGTSVAMLNPEYGLHKTADALQRNLLKIFPLVSSDFKIHIITPNKNLVLSEIDRTIIKQLGALITLGEEYQALSKYFKPDIDKCHHKDLLVHNESVIFPLELVNKQGKIENYQLEIKGWIGSYTSTKDRKKEQDDFPDNFISLLSNQKLGEYNIIPRVGKNKLQEVYVVGQLHIDLFEDTDLPDMALSNRQGYKTDDLRYETVINYVSEKLLPQIVNLRNKYGRIKRIEKDTIKVERAKEKEEKLKESVEKYKSTVSHRAAKKIKESNAQSIKDIEKQIESQLNGAMPILGLKNKIDAQKKKILISHSSLDKGVADVVCHMLEFNNVPDEDILYTSSDNINCDIPASIDDVFAYLRDFFVNSYSDEKMYALYITSQAMSKSWFPVTEVGAMWVTQSQHKVFNIADFQPKEPLNTRALWQTSVVDKKGNIFMTQREFNRFITNIIHVCKTLGYKPKKIEDNKNELSTLVNISS